MWPFFLSFYLFKLPDIRCRIKQLMWKLNISNQLVGDLMSLCRDIFRRLFYLFWRISLELSNITDNRRCPKRSARPFSRAVTIDAYGHFPRWPLLTWHVTDAMICEIDSVQFIYSLKTIYKLVQEVQDI